VNKRPTFPEFLTQLPQITGDERVFFTDENWNCCYVDVQAEWDDCDEEEYFSATVQYSEYTYHYASATGSTIAEAITQCLYELDLINKEIYLQYQG
jgi:hypothetical protein